MRTDPLAGFDDHRVNPYVQNFNLEIQRELAKNLTFEARYIGSKGTKLFGGTSLNDVNIFASAAGQTLLDAFNETRAGGDAPLFDLMLRGLELNAPAAVGQTESPDRPHCARAHYSELPGERERRTFASLPEHHDGRPRLGSRRNHQNGGLPDNWLVVKSAIRRGCDEQQSRQLDISLDESAGDQAVFPGFCSSFAYTWSRSLGESGGDGNFSYLDPRNHHSE